jgi:putative sterol carrier protein
VQYLSDEWIEAADATLATAWKSGGARSDEDADSTTTLGYTITATPQGKVTYHLFAGDDGAGVAAGKPGGDADATMELDYDTAVQIAKGETSPQVAFMQGRLKLGGDVTLLIKGAERLSVIGDALASIEDVEY